MLQQYGNRPPAIPRDSGHIQFSIPIKISDDWPCTNEFIADTKRTVQVELTLTISQEKVIPHARKPNFFREVQLPVSVEIREHPTNQSLVDHPTCGTSVQQQIGIPL